MIDPKYQWANQIDVTYQCQRSCSNCTRFVGHHRNPFFMDLDTFQRATWALQKFPEESPTAKFVKVKNKCVGILGGEPLLHPKFEDICNIISRIIIKKEHRGLWTSFAWENTKYADLIRKTFGYINNNRHTSRCLHSPILVSIKSLVNDYKERKILIENCWLQRMWSATITPKGYYFCEVAAAFAHLLNGPNGLTIEPGCWRRPLKDFQYQIDYACEMCGIPLQMEGREDKDNIDDISYDNLILLQDSPRIKSGNYKLCFNLEHTTSNPWRYIQ